jgi:hypothetical protein
VPVPLCTGSVFIAAWSHDQAAFSFYDFARVSGELFPVYGMFLWSLHLMRNPTLASHDRSH